MSSIESRPWGTYEILYDGPECKVKKIIVHPGHRPSYQYHFKREEHWTVIVGEGIVTIDNIETPVAPGTAIVVPVKSKHRIKNTGTTDLVFIETQLGSYFGEDDIVRVEDDYKR